MENIDDYIKNELNEYLKILTDFNSNVTSKNKRTIQKQQKTSNQRQLLLYDMLQKIKIIQVFQIHRHLLISVVLKKMVMLQKSKI